MFRPPAQCRSIQTNANHVPVKLGESESTNGAFYNEYSSSINKLRMMITTECEICSAAERSAPCQRDHEAFGASPQVEGREL